MFRKLRALGAAGLFALSAFWAPQLHAATLLPPGENCFQATTGLSGMVGALGTITGGSGGVTGTYGGVPLTGGSGTGATANVTVSGGLVTSVAILNPGVQYVIGDVLSAVSGTIGNVSGFSVPVNSISINSSLTGGTVGFYIPNTQTFSQTWQDSAQTILNTNPVMLNQNGCAIIYGEGLYRQILKDSLGNTVWDQLTASTDQGGFFWAGLAGGTPNAITVTDAGFSQTDGQGIQFRANATNTGATTIVVSGGPAIPVVKDTANGPVALTGSEIAIGSGGQNNVISVIYDATNVEFHLIAFPSSTANNEVVPYQGGFKNLVVTNGATPSVLVQLTADQLVLQNVAGQTAKISTVNCAINTTSTTFASNAGGMDSGASVSPVSSWISIWGIYNPTTHIQSCLGSLSATTPSLPSGYTYSARFGWMRTDSAANLMRSSQHGRRARYVVTPLTNTPSLVQLTSGTTGSVFIPVPIGNAAPPTADEITISLQATGAGVISLAPSANYGDTPLVLPVPLASFSMAAGIIVSTPVDITLESTSVYYLSTATSSGIFAYGWEDNL